MNLNNLKLTAFVHLYGILKIPLLAFVSPRIIHLDNHKSIVKIPLGYKTKNHLSVMYFGALAVGAELSIALKAVETIQESGHRIDFLFKSFKADFVKRADDDVHFICDQADQIKDLILRSIDTSDRLEKTFTGYAIVPSKGPEPVMNYELTLSVKNRSNR